MNEAEPVLPKLVQSTIEGLKADPPTIPHVLRPLLDKLLLAEQQIASGVRNMHLVETARTVRDLINEIFQHPKATDYVLPVYQSRAGLLTPVAAETFVQPADWGRGY